MALSLSRRASAPAAAVALVFSALIAVSPAHAAPGDDVELYSTIPETHPVTSPSLSFNSNRIYEYGTLAVLDGTLRQLDRVEVGFVSWACEEGRPTGAEDPCVTTPGSGFDHPLTVNIYEEDEGGAVGDLLGTIEETARVPHRPSSDPENCPDGGFPDPDSEVCANGLYFVASFDFSALELTLPDRVIVAATYNSSNGGYEPIGPVAPGDEDGFNFLNLALEGQNPPSVGTFEDAMYIAGTNYTPTLSGPRAWGEQFVPHIALFAIEPDDDDDDDGDDDGDDVSVPSAPRPPSAIETDE